MKPTHLIHGTRYWTACGQRFYEGTRMSSPTTAPDKVDCKACRKTRAFQERVREIQEAHHYG